MHSKQKWILAGSFLFLLVSFSRPLDLFQKPANFPEPAYSFRDNKVTQKGFELGRKLFYDPVLSANNTISCGSCHIQTAAFTHHGHDVSHGIFDLLGTRNAPAIQNLAWYTSFMWDGGIRDLDLQPIAPITNPVEMGDTMMNVIRKLNADKQYPALFEAAFGSRVITTANLMKALSQFMVMLVSANSKYDRVMRHEQETFTPEEAAGYRIFRTKCASCHPEPLFTDQRFRNNGLPQGDEPDEGRFLVSVEEKDKYLFRVPSLRNLKFTAPYMHDGRYFELDEVLDHYNDGVVTSATLDPLLRKDPSKPGIRILPDEREPLKKFLMTLNDTAFIRDPRFSER